MANSKLGLTSILVSRKEPDKVVTEAIGKHQRTVDAGRGKRKCLDCGSVNYRRVLENDECMGFTWDWRKR